MAETFLEADNHRIRAALEAEHRLTKAITAFLTGEIGYDYDSGKYWGTKAGLRFSW